MQDMLSSQSFKKKETFALLSLRAIFKCKKRKHLQYIPVFSTLLQSRDTLYKTEYRRIINTKYWKEPPPPPPYTVTYFRQY